MNFLRMIVIAMFMIGVHDHDNLIAGVAQPGQNKSANPTQPKKVVMPAQSNKKRKHVPVRNKPAGVSKGKVTLPVTKTPIVVAPVVQSASVASPEEVATTPVTPVNTSVPTEVASTKSVVAQDSNATSWSNQAVALGSLAATGLAAAGGLAYQQFWGAGDSQQQNDRAADSNVAIADAAEQPNQVVVDTNMADRVEHSQPTDVSHVMPDVHQTEAVNPSLIEPETTDTWSNQNLALAGLATAAVGGAAALAYRQWSNRGNASGGTGDTPTDTRDGNDPTTPHEDDDNDDVDRKDEDDTAPATSRDDNDDQGAELDDDIHGDDTPHETSQAETTCFGSLAQNCTVS